MNKWSIRARVLTLAMVPLFIAVSTLTVVYLSDRMADIESALEGRGQAITNNFVLATEHGIVESNTDVLRLLTDWVMAEPDVISVRVFDADNKLLAEQSVDQDIDKDLILSVERPVVSSGMFAPGLSGVIGRVEIQMSRARTVALQQEAILAGVIISSVLLLITLLIARYISQGITYPISYLTQAVNHISDGRLDYRVGVRSGGELGELEAGINAMVSSLEEAEKENEQRYQTLFNFSGDAVFLVFDGEVVDCNAQAVKLLGLGYGELAGSRMNDHVVSVVDREDELRLIFDQVSSKGNGHIVDVMYEVRFIGRDQDYIDTEVCAVPTEIYKQKHLLVLARDITERKKAQQKLERQANFDAVTGLPNRVLVQDRLVQALKAANREDSKVGLMFLDVDRFKNVNDTMGHAAGDILLIEIAQRLQKLVREVDTVARLGGDEFLLVLSNIGGPSDAEAVAKKIIASMSEAFVLEGKEVFLGASVGITMYPQDGADHHALLRNADAAMYKAKHDGRNCYRFFTSEIGNKASFYLELETHLRRVISRQELSVVYQPQVNFLDKKLVGAEALLRWDSPELGQVGLERFIPVAEESGLIIEIGAWVLDQVCLQQKAWQAKGLPCIRVAVNISTRQLKEPGFVELVTGIVDRHGIEPDMIELEITESLLLENAVMSASVLEQLKTYGFRLSLDDFGMGYSSLSYLKRFPFDALKIDRTFVRDINEDPDDAALSNAIVAIGHALDMTVVGEGVENSDQFEMLKSQGATVAQGYFISRPLSAVEFEKQMLQTEEQPKADASVVDDGCVPA